MLNKATPGKQDFTPKTIDWGLLWSCLGVAVSIVLYYVFRENPYTVVLSMVALFCSLIYPAFHAPDITARLFGFRLGRVDFYRWTALIVIAMGVTVFGFLVWPVPHITVKTTFKSSPLFTEAHKKRLTKIVNDFHAYLTAIGFEIPKEVPPLGVAKGLLMSGATAHGGPYNADMVIPEESLENPSDSVIQAYSIYLFRELIPQNATNIQQGRSFGEAVRLFADYYRCSFLGARTVEYPPELDTWESTLWSIRQQYGQDFMDKSMFFAIKRWMPYGFDKTGSDFDSYFATRLEMGVAVFDNNGTPLNSIRNLLKERIFGRHLAAINELSDFVTDGNSIEVEFLAKDDSDLISKRETDWIRNVTHYLEQNLGKAYSVRFRSAKGNASMAMPAGHNPAAEMVWRDIEAKKAQLNSFIAELRANGNRPALTPRG